MNVTKQIIHLKSWLFLCLRLVYRKLYPLAIEVCRYLKTPEYQGVSRVLKHWACYKVCVCALFYYAFEGSLNL